MIPYRQGCGHLRYCTADCYPVGHEYNPGGPVTEENKIADTAEWLYNMSPETREVALAAIHDGIKMRDALHAAAVASVQPKRGRPRKDPNAPVKRRKRLGGLPQDIDPFRGDGNIS